MRKGHWQAATDVPSGRVHQRIFRHAVEGSTYNQSRCYSPRRSLSSWRYPVLVRDDGGSAVPLESHFNKQSKGETDTLETAEYLLSQLPVFRIPRDGSFQGPTRHARKSHSGPGCGAAGPCVRDVVFLKSESVFSTIRQNPSRSFVVLPWPTFYID